MSNRTNAVLVSLSLYNTQAIQQTLDVADDSISEIRAVGDFVRIVFTNPEDASVVRDLSSEAAGKLHHDELMLAIA